MFRNHRVVWFVFVVGVLALPQSMGSLGFADSLKLYAVRNAGTQACLEVGP